MRKKIILSLHSKGSVGKSTFMEALVHFYEELKVDWTGFDLDDRHHNFFDRHPTKVKKVDGNVEKSITRFLQNAIETDSSYIEVLDTRAQIDELIISVFEKTRILQEFQESRVSITLVLFPTNDHSSMGNLGDILKFFQDRVEYVVVKNPSVSESFELFDNSRIPGYLSKLGSMTLKMPKIGDHGLSEFAATEKKCQGLSFREFATNGNKYGSKLASNEYMHFLIGMCNQLLQRWQLLFPSDVHEDMTKPINDLVSKLSPDYSNYMDFY
jgi:hypothetical protein